MQINASELPTIRRDHATQSIALRLGTYDILHAGHLDGIQFAAEQADILVVGVMPDEYVARVKGPSRPLNTAAMRAEAIDRADEVNYTFIAPGSALGVLRAISALRPNVYVEGVEHGSKRSLKAGILRAIGVEYVSHVDDSTGSSSWMVSQFGHEEARRISSLQYRCNYGASE